MTDSKEVFVAKIMDGLAVRAAFKAERAKMARIAVSEYLNERYIAALRKRVNRTKQGRQP
jgi:hypothetical protein